MERQTKLWLSIRIYQIGKCLQPIFQICYIVWLAIGGKDETILPTFFGSLILLLILISYYSLYKNKEKLFDENKNFFEYKTLIGLEVAIFLITLSAYPSAIVHFTHIFKYNDQIKHLYPRDSENSTGLEVNEMNNSIQDLPGETFDEEIENTTSILIDKALKFQSGFISFMNIEENSSEIAVIPKDEYSVKTPFHRVTKDINIFILVTLCSFLNQLTVFLSLGWIEFIKYKIRTAPPPLPPPQRQRISPQLPLPFQKRSPPERTSPPPPPERTLPPSPPERTLPPPPPERTLPQPPPERTSPPPPPERTLPPPPPPERTSPPPPERTSPPPPERTSPPPPERTSPPPPERTSSPPPERTRL